MSDPQHAPRFFTRVRKMMDENTVRERPLWQRIIYPFVGIAAIIFGIFAAVMPVIPGGLLIPIGFIFLMCFHPRCERWIKRTMTVIIGWTERIWMKLFPSRRS